MTVTSAMVTKAKTQSEPIVLPHPPAPGPVVLPGITDTIASRQWHLGKIGDIAGVWADYNGTGVKVGIYDSGVQYSHWDLGANYDASLHVTVDGRTYDGASRAASGPHGTSVAGIVAAARNGEGTVGIAYGASITGVNIFDPYSGGGRDPGIFINADNPLRYFKALAQGAKFDVNNHSYGAGPNYSINNDRGNERTFSHWQAAAVEFTAETGRGGLGTINVAAAGNSGLDMGGTVYTDRHYIAVAAHRHDGLLSSYSNTGSGLLISAPSDDYRELGGAGIVTTDLLGDAGYNTYDDPGGDRDDTDQFGGTSAAAPVVTAAVALMLDANAGLGWRDVSAILASSATMPVPFDQGVVLMEVSPDPRGNVGDPFLLNRNPFRVAGKDANWNGGGHHYNFDYGFGALDVHAAVRMAEVWSLFGPAKTSANEVHVETATFDVGLTSAATREGGDPGNNFFRDFEGTPTSFSFTITDDIKLEHVDMVLTYSGDTPFFEGASFSMEGDRVKLIAPDGTTAFVDSTAVVASLDEGLQTFTFGFRNFAGTESAGEWTLQFEAGGVDLTVHNVKLDLYGSQITANDVFTYTDEFFAMTAADPEGGRTLLSDTDGGVDWINAAALTRDVELSLLGGGRTKFGGVDAFTVAVGTLIENAVTGDGNDRLFGNALDNRLYGMRGNDWLNGGEGNDSLYGGQGGDVFAFDTIGASGRDVILDWSTGDRIATSKQLRGGGRRRVGVDLPQHGGCDICPDTLVSFTGLSGACSANRVRRPEKAGGAWKLRTRDRSMKVFIGRMACAHVQPARRQRRMRLILWPGFQRPASDRRSRWTTSDGDPHDLSPLSYRHSGEQHARRRRLRHHNGGRSSASPTPAGLQDGETSRGDHAVPCRELRAPRSTAYLQAK